MLTKKTKVVSETGNSKTTTTRPERQQGTSPMTIAEAVEHESSRQQNKKRKLVTRALDEEPIIDILAVVERALIRPSQPLVGEVWIVDASINTDTTSAVVCFYDKQTIQDISEAKVLPGDVLRFNRVSLLRTTIKHAEGGDAAQPSKNNDNHAIMQSVIHTHIFHHSWDNPEAGPLSTRLWSIDENVRGNIVVPESMATDPTQLEALISWFRRSPLYQKTTSARLGPIRCRRRTLNEIHSSIGLTSNVIVTVCSVETLQHPPTLARRSGDFSNINTRVILASVSDPHGKTRMSFVDLNRRWEGVLRNAFQSQQPILLNNVTCRNNRHIPAVKQQNSDCCIVLVPTDSTSIAPFPNDDVQPINVSTQPFLTTSLTQTQKAESCLFSTQQPQLSAPTSRKTLELEECLQDIVIVGGYDGISSLREKLVGSGLRISSLSLMSLLIDGKHRCYRRAAIKVGRTYEAGDGFTVHTNSNLMRVLCGGVEPNELLSKPSLQHHVYRLIQGLLDEPVKLRWVLESKSEDAGITAEEEYDVLQVSIVALI